MATPTEERLAATPVQPQDDLIEVEGNSQLELFEFGGKQPTSASITFTGMKARLVQDECYRKGSRIRGTFEAVVTEVSQVDEWDGKAQVVTDCEQKHKAVVIDLEIESAG